LKKRGRIIIAIGMIVILTLLIVGTLYYEYWKQVGFILLAIPLFIVVIGMLIAAILNNEMLFQISFGIMGVLIICLGVIILILVINDRGVNDIILALFFAFIMIGYGILFSIFSFKRAHELRAKKSE